MLEQQLESRRVEARELELQDGIVVIAGNTQNFGVNSVVSYGDLAFLMPGDERPAAGMPAMLTVLGTDRARAAFNTALTATIPAPAAN